MSLGLDDLNDIRTICEEGSFRQAARRLGLTQPTLSRRVELMERRLGARLFERSRGRSQPTALAFLIAQRSASLLAAASRLVTEVQRISTGAVGTVRMGLGAAVVYGLFESLVSRARIEMPQATLVCLTGDTSMLMAQLERQEIDLALCVFDPQLVRPNFHSQALIHGQIEILCSPEHSVVKHPPSTIGELFDHDVAMPVLEPMYRSIAIEQFGIDLSQMDGVIYCSDYCALANLACRGDYVVLGPAFAFRGAVRSGVLVSLPLPVRIEHEVHLITNRGAIPVPAVESMLSLLRHDMEELLEGIPPAARNGRREESVRS